VALLAGADENYERPEYRTSRTSCSGFGEWELKWTAICEK
jgi:hypothetical protein